jgi:hypothetical protein
MEIIKQTANYYNFETISEDYENFIRSSFDELAVGDIVCVTQGTYSQKYCLEDYYSDYNCVKYGILLTKNQENPSASILYIYNSENATFEERNLYYDPGTSGYYIFDKYIK